MSEKKSLRTAAANESHQEMIDEEEQSESQCSIDQDDWSEASEPELFAKPEKFSAECDYSDNSSRSGSGLISDCKHQSDSLKAVCERAPKSRKMPQPDSVSEEESCSGNKTYIPLKAAARKSAPAKLLIKKAASDSSATKCNNGQTFCKKYMKMKYEIDCQNYIIEKLNLKIETKCRKGASQSCLHLLNNEMDREVKKLEKMLELVMQEQKQCKNKNWGPIPITFLNKIPTNFYCPPSECSRKKNKLLPPQTPSDISKISGFSDIDISDQLLSENERLVEDRHELQQLITRKDNSIQEMQQKIEKLHCELTRLFHENEMLLSKLPPSGSATYIKVTGSKLKWQKDATDALEKCIKNMQSDINILNCDLEQMKKEKIELEKLMKARAKCLLQPGINVSQASIQCSTSPQTFSPDASEIPSQQLQMQYKTLLTGYCEKEKECKQMTERLKRFLEGCDNDKERAENELLKKRADQLFSEIDNYKMFIKELQSQVDNYKCKFMKAQEKVEEQRYLLENFELKNSQIEGQINDEVAGIKAKFQEKLSELCPYPKKYEDTKAELDESKEQIMSLERDLKMTLQNLCNAKCELKILKEHPDESLSKKYEKLQCEVKVLKEKYCSLKSTKTCMEEKLTEMKNELEDLRKDSARIINTTKCCAEKNRQIMNEHINCLEVDLAQGRASANLSLCEKEATIKTMQKELTTLCSTFNDAQAQIKQLKNQVTYLTNQRHHIRAIDLHKIDYCQP